MKETDAMLGRLRLLQLTSPNLPIGGFTYSQGLEFAVETGWVSDVPTLCDWLQGLLEDAVTYLEVPSFARLYDACERSDKSALEYWGLHSLAGRESNELRMEEQQRARAFTRLIIDLEVADAAEWEQELRLCQAAPFALATCRWDIALEDAALGYVWSWLENSIAAAIKLIPLGQTDGQRAQLAMAKLVPNVVSKGLSIPDDAMGTSAPAMALASTLHETQYTRLFRS
ncbi:MAG: urease accessory protein UreF [Pseudomonadota bacterium]